LEIVERRRIWMIYSTARSPVSPFLGIPLPPSPQVRRTFLKTLSL
jgi:hypothetical protein